MSWFVPKMWPGSTVAVLASGPSMSREVADSVRGFPAVVVNSTFRLAPWADVLYGADEGWWNHPDNRDALEFSGLKLSIGTTSVDGVLTLRNTGGLGFDPDPGCLRTIGNSGAQAIQVAVHAGATRILLLGFDMTPGHWHPEHKPPLAKTHPDTYPTWVERFETLAVELEKRGVDVINCTPDSALRCFPMMKLADSLRSADDRVVDDVLHLDVQRFADAA